MADPSVTAALAAPVAPSGAPDMTEDCPPSIGFLMVTKDARREAGQDPASNLRRNSDRTGCGGQTKTRRTVGPASAR